MANSRKAIKASVINEVHKEYERKYKETFDRLKSDNGYYHAKNKELVIENSRLENENIRLKDENEKLKDWNMRLMAFMDLPEDERNEAIKAYKVRQDTDIKLAGLMKMFSPLFDSIGF